MSVDPTMEWTGKRPTPQPHSRFFRFLLGSNIRPIPVERPHSLDHISPVGWWTYSWLFPFLRTGYDRTLTLDDIPVFPEKDDIAKMYDSYVAYLDRHQDQADDDYIEAWAVLHTIRWILIKAVCISALMYAGQVAIGVVINRLVLEAAKVLEDGPNSDHGVVVGYVVGFTLLQMLVSICLFQESFYCRLLSERTRQLVVTVMNQKMLRVSPQERQDFSVGKITSILTTDSRRLGLLFRMMPRMLPTPVQFGGSLGVLVWLLGPIALVGFGVILISLAVSLGTAGWLARLRDRADPHQDERIGLTREAVKNMHILKFYGWEVPYAQMIHAARLKEVFYIRMGFFVETFVTELLTMAPVFAGVLTFALKIVIGHGLRASEAFPALNLFQNFNTSMWTISEGLEEAAEAFVAIKRANSFFRLKESVPQIELVKDLPEDVMLGMHDCTLGWFVNNPESNSLPLSLPTNDSASENETKVPRATIQHMDGTVMSSKNEKIMTSSKSSQLILLKHINCRFKRGSVNLIMGPVGSGKTTLLQGLLDLCPKFEGQNFRKPEITVHSVLTNWSKSGRIRDNILFGREFNRKHYGKVVKICDLQSDFMLFNNRDMHEIGENGVTLSGGQRARLALARCLYADGDVLIMDDVLSAMDAKVGSYIFQELVNLVRNEGKVLIMSTNNKAILSQVDSVFSLDGKGSGSQGSPAEVTLNFHSTPTKDDFFCKDKKVIDANLQSDKRDFLEEQEFKDHLLMPIKSKMAPSFISLDPADLVEMKNYDDEYKAIGTVKNSVIVNFFQLTQTKGLIMFCLTALGAMGSGASLGMMSVFMNWWTSNHWHEVQGWYIGFYSLIVLCESVAVMVLTCTLVFYTTSSSTHLFQVSLDGVMKAPMSFFRRNPLGRIMTRFTENLTQIDTQLMENLKFSLLLSAMFLGSSITVFVYVPWSILCLAPIILCIVIVAAFYRDASRDLNRCVQLFESIFYSEITENIDGVQIIADLGQQRQTLQSLITKSNDVLACVTLSHGSICWVGLRCALSTNILAFVALMLAVFNVYRLDASKVGMLLDLLPLVCTSVSFLIPRMTMFENEMNSVERLNEYAHELENEYVSLEEDSQLQYWYPSDGTVVFDNVSLKYSPDLPNVLNSLSFRVEGGKKLGICGRTGAGKSTIISALFRFVALSGGDIHIDGVNIQKLPLGQLRKALSIIPQEPVLFQGTIRSNLDPFDERTDQELWTALNNAGGLADRGNGKFHLDSPVEMEGNNFSLGERQLLALARALIRGSKILILDEATANVDEETDDRVQQTIRAQFKTQTVITIAHRIKTILDYDQIMVMGPGGVVLEKGTPAELIDMDGEFAALLAESKVE